MRDFEKTGMQLIAKHWLQPNNNLQFFNNKFARIDGTFISGNTDVVFEYKTRDHGVENYDDMTMLLEESKYKALRTASVLLNAPCLYICEYMNAVLFFDLTNRNLTGFRDWNLPGSTFDGSGTRTKKATGIELTSADFVYSKRTGQRVSTAEFKKALPLMVQRRDNFK